MFGKKKVTIDEALYERVVKAAKAAGYSSVDELVADVLDKAASEVEGVDDEAEVRKRLQGLGYING